MRKLINVCLMLAIVFLSVPGVTTSETLSNWKYRKQITVVNNSSNTATTNIVNLDATFDYSKALASGDDIVFVDPNYAFMNFEKKHFDTGVSATFQVATNIPAGSTYNYYMYFNNPLASSSSATVGWASVAGSFTSREFVDDGTFIYVGSNGGAPGRVAKISKATNQMVGFWSAGSGQTDVYALLLDNVYATKLWVGSDNGGSVGMITELNTSTMAEVQNWTDPAVQPFITSLVQDTNNLYAGVHTAAPSQIYKLTKSVLNKTATYTPVNDGEHNYPVALAITGSYVYSGYALSSPAKIDKIYTGDMSLSAAWSMTNGQISVRRLLIDNNNLYALFQQGTSPGENSNPGKLTKIDLASPTTSMTWTAGVGQGGRALSTDGIDIYVGTMRYFDSTLFRIASTTLTTTETIPIPDEGKRSFAILNNGGRLYYSTYSADPTRINSVQFNNTTTLGITELADQPIKRNLSYLGIIFIIGLMLIMIYSAVKKPSAKTILILSIGFIVGVIIVQMAMSLLANINI